MHEKSIELLNTAVADAVVLSLSTGRHFEEILRLLVALQTANKHKVATPAGLVFVLEGGS